MADSTDPFKVIVTGVDEIKKHIDAGNKRVDAATIAAIKATQALAKKSVRKEIAGRPRWDHRGKSSRTGEGVRLNLSPHRESRGGGPGILTGKLRRGVGGVRRPRKVGQEFRGGVGVGGGVRNLYKGHLEQKYPYLKPGVDKATPQFAAIYEAAWRRAIHEQK